MPSSQTSKYEGIVICPKCGRKGEQYLHTQYYYPKTDRFGGRREYKYRVVVHRVREGRKKWKVIKVCMVENLNPIFKRRKKG